MYYKKVDIFHIILFISKYCTYCLLVQFLCCLVLYEFILQPVCVWNVSVLDELLAFVIHFSCVCLFMLLITMLSVIHLNHYVVCYTFKSLCCLL